MKATGKVTYIINKIDPTKFRCCYCGEFKEFQNIAKLIDSPVCMSCWIAQMESIDDKIEPKSKIREVLGIGTYQWEHRMQQLAF